MSTPEVIIIGGGPAGLSAAISASKFGLDTLVLEEHNEIGEPLACGEGISIEKLTSLDNMPKPDFQLNDDVLRLQKHDSFIERVIDTQRFFFGTSGVATSHLATVTINRPLFDKLIAKKAQKYGAKIRLGTTVLGIRRHNGILEVQTNREIYQAKIVIGCDGPAAHSVKMMRLKPPSKYVQAVEYKVEGVFTDALDFYFDFEIPRMHYGWVFPKRIHTNIGVVVDPASKPMEILDRFIDYIDSPNIKNAKIIRKIAGVIPASGPIPEYYTDNFMATGDAAGMTNSIFYGGIAIGIHAASLAAQTATEAYEENDFSAGFLQKYQARCQKFPYTSSKIQKGHEALYNSFTAEDLNILGNWFDGWDITEFNNLQKILIFFKALRNPKMFRKFKSLCTGREI